MVRVHETKACWRLIAETGKGRSRDLKKIKKIFFKVQSAASSKMLHNAQLSVWRLGPSHLITDQNKKPKQKTCRTETGRSRCIQDPWLTTSKIDRLRYTTLIMIHWYFYSIPIIPPCHEGKLIASILFDQTKGTWRKWKSVDEIMR